jgi:hypothetical protein
MFWNENVDGASKEFRTKIWTELKKEIYAKRALGRS